MTRFPRVFAAAAALVTCLATTLPAAAQGLTGAGSTLAYPLLAQWSKAYARSQTDAEFQPVGLGLDYEPIGSQAGIMRLKEGAVDFAVTEMPLGAEELSRYGFAQFPIVIGGVTVAYNVEGVASGRLRLTGEMLADIYRGQIKTWADPALKALNPDLALPDAPIAVLRRQDGSGTTFNFTNYLSGQSASWKQLVGEGLTVVWPVGSGAKGNEAVADAVLRTPNSIGYVDFAQARKSRLAVAALRNRTGEFVSPTAERFRAAASGAAWANAKDFGLLLNDAPGPEAYPIVATAFAVLPRHASPSRGTRMSIAFFHWALDAGAVTAADLGYVPLPPDLVEGVRSYWSTTLKTGS